MHLHLAAEKLPFVRPSIGYIASCKWLVGCARWGESTSDLLRFFLSLPGNFGCRLVRPLAVGELPSAYRERASVLPCHSGSSGEPERLGRTLALLLFIKSFPGERERVVVSRRRRGQVTAESS